MFKHIDQPCDAFMFPFRNRLHRIITDVAYPASDAADLPRAVFRMGAKAHALHAALYPNMGARRVIWVGLHVSSVGSGHQ